MRRIAIVDYSQVQFAPLFCAIKFALIAQVCQKIAVPIYVALQPLQFADECAFGFFVFRIKVAHLLVQQIAEKWRCSTCPVLGRNPIWAETAPPLGFCSRNISPTDLLRILEDAGLDGLMFAGLGHIYAAAALAISDKLRSRTRILAVINCCKRVRKRALRVARFRRCKSSLSSTALITAAI